MNARSHDIQNGKGRSCTLFYVAAIYILVSDMLFTISCNLFYLPRFRLFGNNIYFRKFYVDFTILTSV